MSTSLSPTNQLASAWLAAASTGFARSENWKAWADKIILRADIVPDWLIDLSLANTDAELYKALATRKSEEDFAAGDVILIGDSKLGFYYLRFERGDYSLHQFLSIAGDEAEGGTGNLRCESVYDLLNLLEASKDPSVVNILMNKVADLFSPFRKIADQKWNLIQSAVTD